MPLTPGSRLGPYEVLSAIGAGGMGEVYRARDGRLGRDVAIKVLPGSFSADADRLRRFEQEAKAAGILNHPNITAVYDIGSHDGAPYVVQELLEGETLRSELASGKLSARTAIDYALQIVHGLAAAHEKGIVHRDLKPENIFVTKDGRVKILDFGLAKLTHNEEKGAQTSIQTATQGTEPGVVLGTLGYMSPEQVRGRSADPRSDIFSFGAILYEMLSGKRAFHGDSAADTMSAILKEDPPDLSVTNQNVPPALERIIRHCLEKNPERRFHSAHDLAFDLEALSGLSTPRLEPTSASHLSVRMPSRWVAAGLLAMLAFGLFAGWLLWRRAPESPPTFRRLTFRRGPVSSARFGPDGLTVVYSASWDGAREPQLFSTRVESLESVRLTLPDGKVEAISRGSEMLLLKPSQFSTGYAAIGTSRRRRFRAAHRASCSRMLPMRTGHRTGPISRSCARRSGAIGWSFPPERFCTRRPGTSATRASLRRETPSRSSITRSSGTIAARSRSSISPGKRRRSPKPGRAPKDSPGPHPARRSGSPRPDRAARGRSGP